MTTTISRRAALLGTAAIPAALAPLGATAEIPQSAEPDPFVSAFFRWEQAEQAYLRACDEVSRTRSDEDDERANAACDAAAAAMLEMGETVPTTTLGLYLGICALLPVFGEYRAGGNNNPLDFDDMVVRGNHTNGCDGALLRSLRSAAERILNGNEEAV